MKNCILIGNNSGIDLPKESDGIVIIGDNIKNLDHSQKNVLFIGDYLAIGETLNGVPFNLKKVITDYATKYNQDIQIYKG